MVDIYIVGLLAERPCHAFAHELGLIGKPKAVLIIITVSFGKQLWAPSVKIKGRFPIVQLSIEGVPGPTMNIKIYSSNTNSACPAATAITCRPLTENEIGADLVCPPSEACQTSRPVSTSTAKHAPPDAPNTNPPSVESRPL